MSDLQEWAPHDYQNEALELLYSNERLALHMDAGLGKTSTMLALILRLKSLNAIRGVLIIAPVKVGKSVWPAEMSKWSNLKGLSHRVLHGNEKTRKNLWDGEKDIYIINPEGLKWLHEELFLGISEGERAPFNALIVDESSKFKNHKTATFKYLKNTLYLFRYRYTLTATPAPNSYLDLWSQMYILDDGEALGKNFYRFRKKYFKPSGWNQYDWKIRSEAADEIKSEIRHLVLDIGADGKLKMPKLNFKYIKVSLSDSLMVLYKNLKRDGVLTVGDETVSAESSAQMPLKCQQFANGKIYADEDGEEGVEVNKKIISIHDYKKEALRALCRNLGSKSMLIGYHFKHDLDSIREVLGDIPVIGSGVSSEESLSIEKNWNDGKIQFLAGHPAAMGHGLNLQKGGNNICWFGPNWNLELNIQFNARIFRQGVRGDEVNVYYIVAENTIDEVILERILDKESTQTDLRIALRKHVEG